MNALRERITVFAAIALIIAWSGHFGLAKEDQLASVTAGGESNHAPGASSTPPLFVLSSPTVPTALADVVEDAFGQKIQATSAPAVSGRLNGPVIVEPAPGALAPEESSLRPAAFRPVGNIVLPTVAARAAFVADLETGESYFDFNTKQRWPIASITKLMTAVIATDAVPPETEIDMTDSTFPSEDTTVGKKLKPGERYAASDLMTAMLTVSSNEAAEALAQYVSRTDFLSRMNARAKAWGMLDTYFTDPTGLSSANQSTAADLQKLAWHIYSGYPSIFQASRKLKASIYEVNSKKRQTLANINQFAGEAWFVGGKTGYTDDASGNLLTVFTHSHRPVITVVLGTDDRFGESEKLIDWFTAQYKLASIQ